MSAEREVVNFWLNLQGFFTVSNIKASGNRDIGILALKFKDEKIDTVQHVEVSCSISGGLSDGQINKDLKTFIDSRFYDEDIVKTLRKKIGIIAHLERMLVIGSRTNMDVLKEDCAQRNIQMIEFEDVLIEVLRAVDTQYYKDEVIRTVQLFKFLYLANPSKLAKSLSSESYVLNLSKRQRFLKELLGQESMMSGFKRTSDEELMNILKHATVKDPEKLARLVEEQLLNRRTRKAFLDALNKREKIKEVIKGEVKEEQLSRFF